ncbi:hypothetical protein PT974_05268 [Cladobotryum mycophilum]|uniref:Small secreted protein n=1 Tax=Cladobotryum mycophilum TaxID=491253 RepID=A0ABR0SJI4_9HYPO
MFFWPLLWATAAATGGAVLDSAPTTLALNITAINGRNGESVLECWQLKQKFTSSATPGTAGALSLTVGDASKVTYTIIPGQFDGGLHNAPAAQLVHFISGVAHITLPSSKDEAWIHGGKYGLIAAVDTAAVSKTGHRTQYPSMADTIGLQLPLNNWSAANYTVLHSGACGEDELTAL